MPRKRWVMVGAAVIVVAAATVWATRPPARNDPRAVRDPVNPTSSPFWTPPTRSPSALLSPDPISPRPSPRGPGRNTRPRGRALQPSLSAAAEFIAFSSFDRLARSDTNGFADVYVRRSHTDRISLVSVAAGGGAANGPSGNPAITPDGTRIAFVSEASNLVEGDTNGVADVFVRDLVEHRTILVSLSATGSQGNGPSGTTGLPSRTRLGGTAAVGSPSISDDGDRIAFESDASNLVEGDDNRVRDVFVRSIRYRQTMIASVAMDGTSGNGPSKHPSISGEGTLVAFDSKATDLTDIERPSNDFAVFVRDLRGTTRIVSTSTGGEPWDGRSEFASIAGDGGYVAYVHSGVRYSQQIQEVMVKELGGGHHSIEVNNCGDTVCMAPALSRDGKVWAYIAQDYEGDFFWNVKVYKTTWGGPYAAAGWLRLSPEGRYLGFETPDRVTGEVHYPDFIDRGAMIDDRFKSNGPTPVLRF